MDKNKDAVKTLKDLIQESSPIPNTNEVHRSRLNRADRIALFMTKKIGTMTFFYLCLVLVTIPLFLPSTLPIVHYISSGYLQLLLLPLILVAQNIASRHSELLAEHNYETGTKAKKEIEAILLHLEKQHELLIKIHEKMESLEKSTKK